jgi:VanZ family protein
MSRLSDFIKGIPLRFWQLMFWLVWCIATTFMVLPGEDLPPVQLWDKAEHAMTFFVLMTIAWLAYRRHCPTLRLAILLVIYGFAIECIQYFIPSRSFSLEDVLADGVGVLPAFWIAVRLKWS